MPSQPASPSQWQTGPIIRWLLDEGRMLPDFEDIVRELGHRILDAGAPLWRLRLAMRTLHPLTTAVTFAWEREDDTIRPLDTPHGLENRPDYFGSPLEVIGRTRMPLRIRLSEPLTDDDHAVLHELKARGATDYFGLPMRFSDGASAIGVFASDTADGFSELDLKQFTEIGSILAPITEVFSARGVSLAVAEAYLGQRTGPRVLDGKITRGDIEKIDAAVLVSDIRDWTGLNNRVPAETALALANRYFEVIAEAVEGNGGEILKFIGDGVLAIFPTDSDELDAAAVCARALAAARQALQIAADLDPSLDLRFGIGMHFGEVLYGNIGSKTRIDFTVLGQAVNIAARIEGLCSRYDRHVLFSQEFAYRLAETTVPVGVELLKGNDATTPVHAMAQDL